MSVTLKALLKNDFFIGVAIALLWQLIMTLIGHLLFPDPDGKNMLHHMMRWDGGWYLIIIQDHYIQNAASAAFYPLFPVTVGLLSIVTFGFFNYSFIALTLNTISLGFAIAGLLVIARHFGVTSKLRYLCVALFLLSPAAFFLHQFYGEALFVAIAFWAYAFALKRQWLFVGILLAALTAARLPALLFIGLCALEYLRAYDWSIKKALNRNASPFLLVPLGFITYGLYLLAARGDFFAMFNAYKATTDWAYHTFNPNFIYTIAHGAYEVILALVGVLPLTSLMVTNIIIPLISLILLGICSLYLIVRHRGIGIPLGIFGLVSIIFFTLNNNLVSIHRYTLPCLGIYIALTLIYSTHRKLRPLVLAIAILTAGIQTLLIYWLYTTDKFVG